MVWARCSLTAPSVLVGIMKQKFTRFMPRHVLGLDPGIGELPVERDFLAAGLKR